MKPEFYSKECVFLCYSNLHKGFKCLEINTGRIYIFRASLGTTFFQGFFVFPREISSFSLGKLKIPWEIAVAKLALRDVVF
jgi:hypothetical protein